MKKILSGSLLFLTILGFFDAAAQKRQYTMAEAVNGLATTLAPQTVRQAAWRPGTHELTFVYNNRLVYYNADQNRADSGVALDFFNATSKTGDRFKVFPGIKWIDKNSYFFMEGEHTMHIADVNSKSSFDRWPALSLKKDAANISYQRPGNYAVYTVENDLWINKDGRNIPVTMDVEKHIINGQAVHRNEFGIDRGIFPSPKGNYLAYYRMDETMVEDYPVIDWSVTPAKNENIKYPMAGRRSHEVTLQIYNIATGETIPVKTEGPKDQYLTCVTWNPDEKFIYIGILNRDQNHLWLNQYDARTGEKTKTLLQEKDKKYVEPQHPLSFLPGSSSKFIWWSQRDGYMHLWLCDIAKNEMRCLTPGSYVVNDLLGFNTRNREVLMTSAKESPLEKHGYAVNWETGKMRRLDAEPGVHSYLASDDGEVFYDLYTSESATGPSGTSRVASVAKACVIRTIDGSVAKTLINAPNTLDDFERPVVRKTVINASDGTPLYGNLILPTHFDANKKYPVIVYLYNGPHVQLIKNSFPASGNLWYEYLAQHGYIVWTMDGRGSANRGQKFEQAVFRQLGTVEMEDQLQGVKFLKSLPYVDTNRMGVHGWSFGGFMTTSLMLRHPGVFKVGVAGGPVMDWSMYEIMYGERYMDTPEQNPEGYKNSALYDKVKNLKGKLLVIHGAQDATVVWQHSIKFLKAAVDANKQVDYFVYPGYEHNVRGKDRVHLMQKITDYFDQNL